MSAFGDAIVYLNDPANWRGDQGFGQLTLTQIEISAAALVIAGAIAVPIGLVLGHTGRGGSVTVLIANVTRALPTLALLTILATFPALGLGTVPTIIALAVFAIPPLLTNTYVGMRDVDPEVKEAARGMGFSPWGLLGRVEVPLAVPLIAAGLRTAAVQVVATATLAALVGGGGLGTLINDGFGNQNKPEIFAGGILVALLALVTEISLALLQRAVTPKAARRSRRRARPVQAADAPEPSVTAS